MRFDIIAKGLSNMVSTLDDRRLSGEVLLMVEAVLASDGSAPTRRSWVFLLLGHSMLRPEVQTFLRCKAWSEEGSCEPRLENTFELSLPFIVRIMDSPSLLSSSATVLDAVTSDTIAKELTLFDGVLSIYELGYKVLPDARLSMVDRIGEGRLLWEVGMKQAVPRAPAPPRTGMEGVPVGDPFVVGVSRRASSARRGGRG